MLMLFVLCIVIVNIYVYQQIVSVGIHKCLVKEKGVKILQLCVYLLASSWKKFYTIIVHLTLICLLYLHYGFLPHVSIIKVILRRKVWYFY